ELSLWESVNAATYTIPLAPASAQKSTTLSLETTAPGAALTCPANTYCANYSLAVYSTAANIGAWSSSGTTLNGNATLATYKVDGVAFVPSWGRVLDRSPSEQMTSPLTLTAGGTTASVDTLAFSASE